MIMPSNCGEETFLRGVPLILVQELRYYFHCRKTCCFHGICRNMPFRTSGLVINGCYLHVKYSSKKCWSALLKTQHHQHIWIPLVQRGSDENCGSHKEFIIPALCTL